MMRQLVFATTCVFLLAAFPARAAQVTRFDLVCKGAYKVLSSPAENKTEARRYSIDVAAKRWCRTDECRQALPIQTVTADQITLRITEPEASIEQRHTISRVTGAYYERVYAKFLGHTSISEGTCERAPFSGFPTAKF
jgi:hypothetical protein